MDIFNDESRLKSRVNRKAARVMIGRQLGNDIKLKTVSFSGVKTIGLFYLRENTSCRVDVDFEILSGRSKVILVRKDTIADIAINSCKEARIFKLERGFNRIRIVGEAADIKLSLMLTKGVTYPDE
ncbi:MAG: hypothetical protein WCX85_01095 [Bacilli bacterium]|jgi:hypothetical protein|nr:hypothetical protein [Bacilli bacterium]